MAATKREAIQMTRMMHALRTHTAARRPAAPLRETGTLVVGTAVEIVTGTAAASSATAVTATGAAMRAAAEDDASSVTTKMTMTSKTTSSAGTVTTTIAVGLAIITATGTTSSSRRHRLRPTATTTATTTAATEMMTALTEATAGRVRAKATTTKATRAASGRGPRVVAKCTAARPRTLLARTGTEITARTRCRWCSTRLRLPWWSTAKLPVVPRIPTPTTAATRSPCRWRW
mmetsp:Transcript_45611/g.79760  ORF Transcript_45611/g.79760 Transcript_45611/m.79760 type:complete len:232 (+) Transcript_45611:534-1229(+)